MGAKRESGTEVTSLVVGVKQILSESSDNESDVWRLVRDPHSDHHEGLKQQKDWRTAVRQRQCQHRGKKVVMETTLDVGGSATNARDTIVHFEDSNPTHTSYNCDQLGHYVKYCPHVRYHLLEEDSAV